MVSEAQGDGNCENEAEIKRLAQAQYLTLLLNQSRSSTNKYYAVETYNVLHLPSPVETRRGRAAAGKG